MWSVMSQSDLEHALDEIGCCRANSREFYADTRECGHAEGMVEPEWSESGGGVVAK